MEGRHILSSIVRALSVFAVAVLFLGVPQVSFALGQQAPLARVGGAAPVINPQSVKVMCDYSFFKSQVEGAFATTGGVFVEYDVPPVLMQLTFCSSSGSVVSVATPPSGAPQYGYASMAGVKTSTAGTVLVLDVNDSSNNPGFWFCEGATSSGCGIKSTYITLPSAFCSAQPFGACNPQGIALDNHLNVYYADPSNADVVKCTFLSGFRNCTAIEALSNNPAGIFRAPNGDLWVTDSSCAGTVWKNGVSQFSFGDQVEGITTSSSNPSRTSHVYFATTGRCFYGFAFIYDLADHQIVTPFGAPFSGPGDIPSITTKLQFTTGSNAIVYTAKDKV